jgi:hypothetical protein
MKVTGWLQNERHRQLVERWWIAIVLLWDILKSIVVDETFAKYGVNPYIYLLIVVTISVPYALSTAKMLFAILANHWRNALGFGGVAIVLHFIPDVYILISSDHVPKSLFDGFIITVLIFTLFAVQGVVSQVRTHRKQ